MLSICIPIYNYDVTALVSELHKQATATAVTFEILLMDDASSAGFRASNSAIDLRGVSYVELSENIGRSKIRNALAAKAQYPYLLFMDCDSAVASGNYIAGYLSLIRPGIVCYGGRAYSPTPPSDATFLRWKYGVERESLPASVRKKRPNHGFCTNNFLIDRNIFRQVSFNEALTGYGHEDTLFGIELLGKGIPIEHIDNPLIHLGLEDASFFLKKTGNSVQNLYKMEQILLKKYPEHAGHSKLMRSKLFLDKTKLRYIFATIYRLLKPAIRKNLSGKNPSLFLFDLYRLGYLISVNMSAVTFYL